jgi:hypothetical protein
VLIAPLEGRLSSFWLQLREGVILTQEGTCPLMRCDRGCGSCGVGVPFQVAHRRCPGRSGGGRDEALCPFGYCAVIMAFACARDRFGAAGPACQRAGSRRTNCRRVRSPQGCCSPGSYKSKAGAEARLLTLPFSSIPHATRLPPDRALRRFGSARAPCASSVILALPPLSSMAPPI